MVFFLVMPGIFLFGLVLIPIGMYREHRARLAGYVRAPGWPVLNLNDPRQLRITAIVAVLTVVNVLIIALAGFQGVHYMDSVQFCGQVCHEVMQPEFASYQAGPHARVRLRAVPHRARRAVVRASRSSRAPGSCYAVAFNTHSRPIPSPVHNLRPARDTCEQCHWPEKFHGDKIRRVPRVRQRCGEHRVGDGDAHPRRRRQREHRPGEGHSLAHEPLERRSSTSPPTRNAR